MDPENLNTILDIFEKIIRMISWVRQYCEYMGIDPYEYIKKIYRGLSKKLIEKAIWVSAFWIFMG